MLPPAVTVLLGAAELPVSLLVSAVVALVGGVTWLGQRLYTVQASHAKEILAREIANAAGAKDVADKHAAQLQTLTERHAAEIAGLSRDRLSEVRSAAERDDEDRADRAAVAKLADALPQVLSLLADHAPAPRARTR